jgi:hypothetical protein
MFFGAIPPASLPKKLRGLLIQVVPAHRWQLGSDLQVVVALLADHYRSLKLLTFFSLTQKSEHSHHDD